MGLVKFFCEFAYKVKYIIFPFIFYTLYTLYSFNYYECIREFENTITSLLFLLLFFYFAKNERIVRYYYFRHHL